MMTVWSLLSYPHGILTGANQNVDVSRTSTNSTSGPTEAEQSVIAETSASCVSHESQKEKQPDPQSHQSDGQNNDNVASSQLTNFQSQITQAIPSIELKNSQSQMIEAISSAEQKDSQSHINETVSASDDKDPQRLMTEAGPPSQQSDSQNQTLSVNEAGSTDESAAGSHPSSYASIDHSLSITNLPQEPRYILPAKATVDHLLPSSEGYWNEVTIARLQLAIRGLSEKREALLGMRVKVQEDRKSVRQRRSALVELNARVLRDVQKKAALRSSASPAPPSELLLELQEALEELQVEEAEFDATEDLLNRKEWELKEAEVEVYQSPLFEQANNHSGDSTPYIVEEIMDTSSDSTVSAPAARSSLEEQYLSLKGDAKILNEQLHQLRAERAYLVEEDRARRAMGRSLDPESQKFLDDFDAQHNQFQQDLFYIEDDIFRLQTTIASQSDILYTTSHFDSFRIENIPLSVEVHLSELAALSNDVLISHDASLADHGTTSDPLLLSKEASSPRFSTVALDSDENSLSTVSYINQWLLHRLRRSTLEILRFKSYLRDIHIDAEQLKNLVLEWWPHDGTPATYRDARRRSRRSFSISARSEQPNLSTQTRRSDSVIFDHHRLAQRSQRGGWLTSRHRSSVTLDGLGNIAVRSQHGTHLTYRDRPSVELDGLVNSLILHRPSSASSF